jgi:hypothetical protein
MDPDSVFPFGKPVLKVVQTDRTPKKVFVLGVYASAVHAQWMDKDGKLRIRALAVASEPCIFWRGENAETIIQQIDIPPELGRLVPADQQYNGPSGRSLDNTILHPMNLDRSDAWLCDLVPHSCINSAQSRAIEREGLRKELAKHSIPEPSVPPLPQKLTDEQRRGEILCELRDSHADTLILLGDLPIQWFLGYFDPNWDGIQLSGLLQSGRSYGEICNAQIGGEEIKVLPLAHPRQICRLGLSSSRWYQAHQVWMSKQKRHQRSF